MIDNKLDLGTVDFGAAAGVFVSDSVDLFGLGNTVQGGFAVGDGHEICLHISVTEAAASGGVPSISLQMVAASDATLASDIETLGRSIDLVVAQLPAGAEFIIRGNPAEVLTDYNDANGSDEVLRYFGLRLVTAAATLTAGIVQVHALPASAINQSRRPGYPSGFSVL